MLVKVAPERPLDIRAERSHPLAHLIVKARAIAIVVASRDQTRDRPVGSPDAENLVQDSPVLANLVQADLARENLVRADLVQESPVRAGLVQGNLRDLGVRSPAMGHRAVPGVGLKASNAKH